MGQTHKPQELFQYPRITHNRDWILDTTQSSFADLLNMPLLQLQPLCLCGKGLLQSLHIIHWVTWLRGGMTSVVVGKGVVVRTRVTATNNLWWSTWKRTFCSTCCLGTLSTVFVLIKGKFHSDCLVCVLLEDKLMFWASICAFIGVHHNFQSEPALINNLWQDHNLWWCFFVIHWF